MSSLIVEVCRIDAIKPHPNPEVERLEIAVVKGWEIIVQKDTLRAGDTAVYFPPDSLMPRSLARELGIEKYVSWGARYRDPVDELLDMGRITAAKLKGAYSYGTLMENKDNLPVGTDVAEKLSIGKWEPPPPKTGRPGASGEQARQCPLFFKYYDIENARNFPNDIEPGEEVVATEKIHGMHARISFTEENGRPVLMIGSHNTRRKRACDYENWFTRRPWVQRLLKKLPRFIKKKIKWALVDLASIKMDRTFELPLILYPQIEEMLKDVYGRYVTRSVVLYGEIYGAGIQDLTYGLKDVNFRAFDLSQNNNYLDYDDFREICKQYTIPMVPELFRGAFDFAAMSDLADGPTRLMEAPAAKDMREGIVVRTVRERRTPKHTRACLKFVSPAYLTRKGGTEEH